MSEQLKRYSLFGWDYPFHAPLTGPEAAWYLKFARTTGGPVLDMPCGTGRLLCRLAQAGFDVTGIDLSDTMLDIARRNVAALPQEVRSRAHLVKTDMSDFRLDRKFALIYIADNSFRELTTRDGQIACLCCARKHLKKHGIFLMTERRFNPAIYPRGRREFGWSGPYQNPATGESVRRRGEIELSPDGRWICGKFIYEVTRPDGTTHLEECPLEGPILHMDDYLALFRDAGLAAAAYADYTESPADGTEKMTCFVCRSRC
jgi:SAM-dependent methyltransferase